MQEGLGRVRVVRKFGVYERRDMWEFHNGSGNFSRDVTRTMERKKRARDKRISKEREREKERVCGEKKRERKREKTSGHSLKSHAYILVMNIPLL